MKERRITFTAERPTKNTVKFNEDPTAEENAIGALYVQKRTLDQLQWEPGKKLEVLIHVQEDK